MEFKRELLVDTQDVPVMFFIESIGDLHSYWNNKISLFFILKGKVRLLINKTEYILEENNVFLINKNTVYSIEGIEENEVCVMELDADYFNNYYADFSSLKFYINSSEYLNEVTSKYNKLWCLVAEIIDVLNRDDKRKLIKANEYLFSFISILVEEFTIPPDRSEKFDDKKQLLETIIEFILDHFKEKLSLTEISKHLHLNPQYVSRYFSKHMGSTLNEFIRNVRLQESINDLKNKNKKITYTALEHGFPNSKSYFKAFKEVYGITPLKYRNIILKNYSTKEDFKEYNFDYAFKKIFSYLDNKNEEIEIKEKHIINLNSKKSKLKKTWTNLAGFGRAAEGLRADWRSHLKMLQTDIPFKYIRFHGIFSDDMMVYSEDYNGNPQYNFNYVDELIDFLLENNIKPFIELSFMPEQLAEEKTYMFFWRANISIPKSIDKWTNLVQTLINHLILRYGIKEVRTWYFEIWINFNNYSEEKCYTLLKSTYLAVKNIDTKLKLGLYTSEAFSNKKIIEDLSCFLEKESILLDFISAFIFSIVPKDDETDISDLIKTVEKLSPNHYIPQNTVKFAKYAPKEFVTDSIDLLIKNLKKYKVKIKEIFITEFNSSPDPKDLLNDTCYKPSFLIKNILDNYNKIEGLAYWVFSDIFDEVKVDASIFNGGTGFIMRNGLKKPIYYAYELLNKLGDIIVKKGDDFIVTRKSNGSFQILAYNYCDFKNSNINCNSSEVTFHNRYNVFSENVINMLFILQGINGQVLKKSYRLNKENGSVFDEYIKMGEPKHLTTEEINYLNRKAVPEYTVQEINLSDNCLINEMLQPHEVLLIELIPIIKK